MTRYFVAPNGSWLSAPDDAYDENGPDGFAEVDATAFAAAQDSQEAAAKAALDAWTKSWQDQRKKDLVHLKAALRNVPDDVLNRLLGVS